MQEYVKQKTPTGITSLDPILGGGIPQGSLVLLLGDIGAGNYEFAYSSVVNVLSLIMEKKTAPDAEVPDEVRYITFTRVKEDVQAEMISSFNIEGLERIVNEIKFDDLSELYFDNSVVPDEWYSHSDIITRLQNRSGREGILLQLSNVINDIKPNSLVVLDSITDIATQSAIPNIWQNLTGFLRGLQRISKQRGITSYLLLSEGILDPSRQKELADIADAVFLFQWEETTGARRQRVMYFEKFRGVMPHLEERDLVKFAVKITTQGGFEVRNIRVVI
jgi:KaiC/GvpD/RAD55 family RecA-like ATPase